MAYPNPEPVLEALRIASERGLLPTALDTEGLRELGADVLARNVFTARGTSAKYLTILKRVVDEIAAGNMDEASARVTIMETLRALGYTPEGGFPDYDGGDVPPAVRGSIQDLSSFQRIRLVVRTQHDLTAGAGQQARGQTPDRLEAFPAWEIVRVLSVSEPRIDWDARWALAGGTLYQGRMIAFKGDPVWGELGSSGNFADALNVDHPPFYFRSGRGWREVPRAEVRALGIRSSTGATLEEWESGERPRTIQGPLPLPAPTLSIKDVAPDIAEKLTRDTFATPAAQPGRIDFSDLLGDAMRRHVAVYQERRAS